MLHRLKTAKGSRSRRAVLLIGAAGATLSIAGLAPASLGSAAYAQLMSPGEIIKRSRARIPAPMPSPGREPAEAAPAASAPTTTGQGINGAMHQAHVGQVVFTRSDLERNGITEAALVNSFRLGDPIFFRVYMREPVIEQFKPKLPGKSNYWISRSIRYKARFTVGGNVVDTKFRIWGKAGDHETWTTWRGELLSRADKFQPGTEIFREFLSRATKRGLMGVGTHQIKLEITPYAINIDGDVKLDGSSSEPPVAVGEVVASGEFSLTVGPGSYAKSDPKICGPATASPNPALEQQILARARAMWTRPEAPPVRVALTYGGWTINRHPISGLVLDRNIDTVIMSRGRDYCDFQSYKYIQPNVGGFSVASSSFESEPHNWMMPCSCLD